MSDDYEPETVLISLPAWNSMVSRNHELQARIDALGEMAKAAIDVVSFFEGKLTLDDEGYFELESLECYLRGVGYYLEEDSK